MIFHLKIYFSKTFKFLLIAIFLAFFTSCDNEVSRENIFEIPYYAIGKIVDNDSDAFLKMFEFESKNPFAGDSESIKKVVFNTFNDAHKHLSMGEVEVVEIYHPDNISDPDIFGSNSMKIAVICNKKIYVLTFLHPFFKRNEVYFRSFEFHQIFPENSQQKIM